MESSKFRISRLLLYFLFVTLFLFISGNTGRYLIETHGFSWQIAMLLQGVIFTGLTTMVLFLLKQKNPSIFKNIGLSGIKSYPKLIIGLVLPFALVVLGILTAYFIGGIENVTINLSVNVLIAIFINSVIALLFEAFPEEVFIRGLIFEELNKKYHFIVSLLLQPLIFICVPIAVTALTSLFLNESFEFTLDYFILLYTFGIALQLYRKYTGSLWMSMAFHIIYLEVTRFISMGGIYIPDIALMEFDESFEGFMSLYLSFLFIVVISVMVLIILLLIDKRTNSGK
ncbi:lysostaphin resistance A-like protein [Planococcus liqunii]|uniref:CPBP family intramembrane glutamic endopeptidase n=1 Tax=Planococcus liqunii TaxID=3058394 RepID=UPI002623652D|nr:CPBP family intramembrane glutamic endopeptidase [Planococcus sp. N056]WKA52662.1 lysostaphin resistance A-like protein [Planococcus sp. N056]